MAEGGGGGIKSPFRCRWIKPATSTDNICASRKLSKVCAPSPLLLIYSPSLSLSLVKSVRAFEGGRREFGRCSLLKSAFYENIISYSPEHIFLSFSSRHILCARSELQGRRGREGVEHLSC